MSIAQAAFRYQQEELTKEAQAEALRSRAAAEEAKHEAAKVQKEVEYLRALLEALDVDQKQSLRGDSLKSGTSRHVSITGQACFLCACLLPAGCPHTTASLYYHTSLGSRCVHTRFLDTDSRSFWAEAGWKHCRAIASTLPSALAHT